MKFVTCFHSFKRLIPSHDYHYLWPSMSRPSVRSELGLIAANESTHEGMHKVCSEIDKNLGMWFTWNRVRVLLERIFFQGDQKTARSGSKAQESVDENVAYASFVPMFMDWHAWKVLFDSWFL